MLEELADRGRQAKVLVLRHASEAYWAPVGVWQIRESIRNAFEGDHGESESFHDAVRRLDGRLPIPWNQLRRKSRMVAGLQTRLAEFAGD